MLKNKKKIQGANWEKDTYTMLNVNEEHKISKTSMKSCQKLHYFPK